MGQLLFLPCNRLGILSVRESDCKGDSLKTQDEDAMAETHDELEQLNALFGREYRLGKLIGRGAMSTVWSATRLSDGFEVAIKAQRYSDPEGMRTLLAPIEKRLEACREVDHPNVIRILDIRSVIGDDRAIFVVLDRSGPDLESWLREHRPQLTIGWLLARLAEIAEGIEAIHQKRIVHCDIKPNNFFLCQELERGLVGDFSISLTEEESGKHAQEDAWGTPAFVAPEQVLATRFGTSVDIYSFAMSIYVLLSNEYAFEGKTVQEFIYSQMSADPIPLRRRNRNWPTELDDALMKSLQKDPDARHRSAPELVADLTRALAAHTPLRLSSFLHGGDLSRFSSTEVRVRDVLGDST